MADLERLEAGVADSVREVDHLIVGRVFARRPGEKRTGGRAAALAALRRDQTLTAVTADGQGYWWAERGSSQVRHEPALKVDVVDTTGCGDVFHGAYAAEIAVGALSPRPSGSRMSTAGLKATQPGGRQGIPTRADVEARLSEENQAMTTAPAPIYRVAISTGGGDAPGLNAVIRVATLARSTGAGRWSASGTGITAC